jgi:hypothetical protein
MRRKSDKRFYRDNVRVWTECDAAIEENSLKYPENEGNGGEIERIFSSRFTLTECKPHPFARVRQENPKEALASDSR